MKASGQMDEAIACYRKAIELDPKNAMAHDSLGSALATKGQDDEAIACFRVSMDPNPYEVTEPELLRGLRL